LFFAEFRFLTTNFQQLRGSGFLGIEFSAGTPAKLPTVASVIGSSLSPTAGACDRNIENVEKIHPALQLALI